MINMVMVLPTKDITISTIISHRRRRPRPRPRRRFILHPIATATMIRLTTRAVIIPTE